MQRGDEEDKQLLDEEEPFSSHKIFSRKVLLAVFSTCLLVGLGGGFFFVLFPPQPHQVDSDDTGYPPTTSREKNSNGEYEEETGPKPTPPPVVNNEYDEPQVENETNVVPIPETKEGSIDHTLEFDPGEYRDFGDPGEDDIDGQPLSMRWIQSKQGIQARLEDCKILFESAETEWDQRLARAHCGTGYDFKNSSALTKRWKVVFFSRAWIHDLGLYTYSGCPRHCPLSPKCVISFSEHPRGLEDADVIVLPSFDSMALDHQRLKSRKKQYKVIYWREAKWKPHPGLDYQRDHFDFEMGVHYYSGLLNPVFPKSPLDLLRGAFTSQESGPVQLVKDPPTHHEYFAASLFSDCNTPSQRQTYVNHLLKYLGKDRIHQYGACGNLVLPKKPIQNALKILAKYKL